MIGNGYQGLKPLAESYHPFGISPTAPSGTRDYVHPRVDACEERPHRRFSCGKIRRTCTLELNSKRAPYLSPQLFAVIFGFLFPILRY